jgi:hypothetical protein
MVAGGVGADHRFVIQRTAKRLGTSYIVSFEQGSGRRDERDPTAAREAGRTDQCF